jgi:hypothetical protein
VKGDDTLFNCIISKEVFINLFVKNGSFTSSFSSSPMWQLIALAIAAASTGLNAFPSPSK